MIFDDETHTGNDDTVADDSDQQLSDMMHGTLRPKTTKVLT